jgi:hypothetical protein
MNIKSVPLPHQADPLYCQPLDRRHGLMYARMRIACSISMLLALDMLGSPGGKAALASDSQSAVSLRCSAALTPSLRSSAGAQAVNKLAAATAMKTGFIILSFIHRVLVAAVNTARPPASHRLPFDRLEPTQAGRSGKCIEGRLCSPQLARNELSEKNINRPAICSPFANTVLQGVRAARARRNHFANSPCAC